MASSRPLPYLVLVALMSGACEQPGPVFVGDDDDLFGDDDDLFGDDDDATGDDDDATGDDDDQPCTPDAYEDNDTQAEASPITPGSYPDLSACDGDDDYYRFAVGAGDVVDVTVAFTHAQGDIDIALLAASGASIAAASSISDDEVLDGVSVPEPGDYTLRVRPVGGSNSYSLDLAVGPGTPEVCPTDSFEPNDAEGAGTALTAGTYGNLHVCEDDEDWYVMTLAADTTISVDATFVDDEGDIDLRLLNPSGTLATVADSSTDNESLGPYTTTESGDYELRVYLNNGDPGTEVGNSYSLDVSIDAPATCPTDPFEDNDSPGAPATLTAGSHPSLHVCNSDEDWYEISLVAGADLTVEASFSHAEGDIDLELFRGLNGDLAAQAGGSEDTELLQLLDAPATDDYILSVILYNDTGNVTGNSYSLEVTID